MTTGSRPAGLVELDAVDTVFASLANETRRQLLVTLLARGGSMTSGELADRFDCTWSTTTRHLQKLEASGLVTVEASGRERRYRLDVERLRAATHSFLDVFE